MQTEMDTIPTISCSTGNLKKFEGKNSFGEITTTNFNPIPLLNSRHSLPSSNKASPSINMKPLSQCSGIEHGKINVLNFGNIPVPKIIEPQQSSSSLAEELVESFVTTVNSSSSAEQPIESFVATSTVSNKLAEEMLTNTAVTVAMTPAPLHAISEGCVKTSQSPDEVKCEYW